MAQLTVRPNAPGEEGGTLSHMNWFNITFTLIVPLFGFISAYWVPLVTKTVLFAIVYYFNTGLGITAGKQ